jgi:hypothetical protein
MTVSELEQGFRDLARQLYGAETTDERRRKSWNRFREQRRRQAVPAGTEQGT